jgi:hypothetical protein
MTSNDLVILCNHYLPAVDWETEHDEDVYDYDDDQRSVIGERVGPSDQVTRFQVEHSGGSYRITVNRSSSGVLSTHWCNTIPEAMSCLRELADEVQAQAAFVRESVEYLAIIASKPLSGGAP